jgi:hypothetical protein
MRPMHVLLVTAVGVSALAFLPSRGTAAQCGGLHKLEIIELDMVPDPARQGQPIQRWVIKLKADGNGECATRIQVKDRDQVAGDAVQWTLRRGENTIQVPANSRYRMQDQDHCFRVVADIQDTRKDIDSTRQFCARSSWTLKGGTAHGGRASPSSSSTRRDTGSFHGDNQGRGVSR